MSRRRERGTTIIEVMVASAVLLVAIVGLAAVMNTAAQSNAVAHRRTVAAFSRRTIQDRLAVTPRDRLANVQVAAPTDPWRVFGCYDVESREVAANDALAADFACPDGTTYRSWIRVEPATHSAFAGARAWQARVYAERLVAVDGAPAAGCEPEDRYSSVNCIASDLLLTD